MISNKKLNNLIISELKKIQLNEELVDGVDVQIGDFVIKKNDYKNITKDYSKDKKYIFKLTNFGKNGKASIITIDNIDKWRNADEVNKNLLSKEISLNDYITMDIKKNYDNFPQSILSENDYIFLRKEIRKILKEAYSELGTKEDLNSDAIFLPFIELIATVRNDWGEHSDLFQDLFEVYTERNVSKIIDVLKEYDVFEKYQHLLNLNEELDNLNE